MGGRGEGVNVNTCTRYLILVQQRAKRKTDGGKRVELREEDRAEPVAVSEFTAKPKTQIYTVA